MTLWTAIVAIVALLCLTEMMKAKHRAKHGIVTDFRGSEQRPAQDNPALQREVEELRERIKVLERIATEDRETKLLSAEIESLREK